jgi:hypothetical protein
MGGVGPDARYVIEQLLKDQPQNRAAEQFQPARNP